MICNSGGSKSRLAKAAGAEPSGQLRDEKLLAVVVKMLKTQHCQSIFWKFRCRKSARRCGANQIQEPTCEKHSSFGACLEVEMLKKCTAPWREAHFQVRNIRIKHLRSGALLEVELLKKCTPLKSRCGKSARRCGAKHIRKSKVLKNRGSPATLKSRCGKSARCCGAKHICKSKVLKTEGLGPLLEVEMSKKVPVTVQSAFPIQKCEINTDGLGTVWDVEMSKKCTPLWREARFWKLRCGKRQIDRQTGRQIDR